MVGAASFALAGAASFELAGAASFDLAGAASCKLASEAAAAATESTCVLLSMALSSPQCRVLTKAMHGNNKHSVLGAFARMHHCMYMSMNARMPVCMCMNMYANDGSLLHDSVPSPIFL